MFERKILDSYTFESDGMNFVLFVVMVSCDSCGSTIATIIVELKSVFTETSFPMYYNDNAICFKEMSDIISRTPKGNYKQFKKQVNESLIESYKERQNPALVR